ncbi:MAG: hypothetical protein JW806_06415 [Sedimentisphaerales bacterium]|nr:hypothetical protein [Sedimentisphaerales bacterium]
MSNIPVIHIEADCLPQAWEAAVLAVWDNGTKIKTQYDKPGDPPSRDATTIITVNNPFAEPRIHKNFPGGPEELEAYRQEVVDGIHDHWIDPAAGKWTYTYHERLFAYCPVENIRNPQSPKPFAAVDQIQYIIDSLAQTAYTRRAQAITWMPTADITTEDPPCLQRIWCRLTQNPDNSFTLNMNTHWRSRDLYKAWFMNVYALTDLQKTIAEKISIKIGKIVKVGRYVDITDAMHIYGSYFRDAQPEIEKMRDKNYKKRSWQSSHPAFDMMTIEARKKLAEDVDWYANARG